MTSKNDPLLTAAYDFMCRCNTTTGNSTIDNLHICVIDSVDTAISAATEGSAPVCNYSLKPTY